MRKTQPKKIPLAPDPKFNDKLVTRFVNNLMWAGKKSGAYIIFYNALDKVAKQTGEDGYEVWKKALGNITPGVEVRSRRIGGATSTPGVILAKAFFQTSYPFSPVCLATLSKAS